MEFGAGLLVGRLGLALRLRSADDHLAAHEWLVMENFDGSLCLLDVCHFDKSIALGFMGISIVDDLDASDSADTLEEFLEFVLSCVIRQVAEIEPVGIYRAGRWGSAGGARGFCYTGPGFWCFAGFSLTLVGGTSTSSFTGRSNSFLIEANRLEDLLPPSQRNAFWSLAWSATARAAPSGLRVSS